MQEALEDVASDGRSGINRKMLGWYLKKMTGRIVGGFKLEKKDRAGSNTRNAQQYRVTRLSQSGADDD